MAGFNPLRNQIAGSPALGNGFNAYAAGDKVYGAGRPMPNVGIGGAQSAAGYNERDVRAAARRKALLGRIGGQ